MLELNVQTNITQQTNDSQFTAVQFECAPVCRLERGLVEDQCGLARRTLAQRTNDPCHLIHGSRIRAVTTRCSQALFSTIGIQVRSDLASLHCKLTLLWPNLSPGGSLCAILRKTIHWFDIQRFNPPLFGVHAPPP